MNDFVPSQLFQCPLEIAECETGPDQYEVAAFFSRFMCSVAAHAGTWPGFPRWRPGQAAHDARSYCSDFCPAPPFYDEMVEVVAWGSQAGVMLNGDWMRDWLTIAGPTAELQRMALQRAMESVSSIGTIQGNTHLCCTQYLSMNGIADDAFLAENLKVVVLDPDPGPREDEGEYPYWVLRTAHELLLARRLLGVLKPNVTRWCPTAL